MYTDTYFALVILFFCALLGVFAYIDHKNGS